MDNIFCISAGQFNSKKNIPILSNKHRYLNYGLLKLASLLGENNYNPIVIHGLFDLPYHTFSVCKKFGIEENKNPILLSIPSFFALEWAKEFSNQIKNNFPNKKIIVGGRWVIGNNPEWLRSFLNVDLVVPGLVGAEILNIVNLMVKKNKLVYIKSNNKNNIDYRYLYERQLFQPSIEVSNGCGMGCSFCLENNIPLSKLKSASDIAKEMETLIINDGLIEITPYLESSMFVATNKWVNELQKAREEKNLNLKWRIESRVDKLKAKIIPKLAKAGLKVIDLGLESADHLQLKRMKKTNDPNKYLSIASDLIKTAYDNDIWVKINILLYAGETLKSIENTIKWISNIRNYLKGVSVSPVIIYGIKNDSLQFIKEIEKHGACCIESEINGVTYINLSKEINYHHSLSISKQISREFMTAKNFFDLKSFSYFSRDYDYSMFLSDVGLIDQGETPFKI